MRMMDSDANERLIDQVQLLRTEVTAIESNLQRLEQSMKNWEANQGIQLQQANKELKNIGTMANWCALAAIVFLVIEAIHRWG